MNKERARKDALKMSLTMLSETNEDVQRLNYYTVITAVQLYTQLPSNLTIRNFGTINLKRGSGEMNG
jgi:hypothetical protein